MVYNIKMRGSVLGVELLAVILKRVILLFQQLLVQHPHAALVQLLEPRIVH